MVVVYALISLFYRR